MAFFQRDILQGSLQWLVDSATIICGRAALCGVATRFGMEWTRDHVLDKVLGFKRSVFCKFCEYLECVFPAGRSAAVGTVACGSFVIIWSAAAQASVEWQPALGRSGQFS
jgi:hypothetical protein